MTTPCLLSEHLTPIADRRSDAVTAALGELEGRPVSWFRLEGGKHRGAIGVPEGDAIERAVRLGVQLGVPIVGVLASSGADVTEGVSALHAWGRVAKALSDASGVVPTLLGVTGPCVSGPAMLLGLVDQVVMTSDAFAYVSGPETVVAFTGLEVTRRKLGGASVHATRSGVAALVVDDDGDVPGALADLLGYLPANHLDDPPRWRNGDPLGRDTTRAAEAVPAQASAAYDVRIVVTDVLDDGSMLELRPQHATNIVTALGRVDGRPVSVVANQPAQRAGTIDIDAARKAARFVQWCDAFNLPLLTFVDTPGFEPGRDLEWRGMIRHGAQLVHAYAAATVPRLCVVLRKAYGGAYIVMDSRGLGNHWCAAWPRAEIAVIGARGAVQVLHGRRLAALPEEQRSEEQAALVADYDRRFANPYVAAERGLVDAVIAPLDTRRHVAAALDRLMTLREPHPARTAKHSNTPL